MTEICARCGKPITMGQDSFYLKSPGDDIGQAFHANCGKGAEVERLTTILRLVANDSRAFHLHERTKELLRPFVIEHLDGLPVVSRAEGLKSRTGQATKIIRD